MKHLALTLLALAALSLAAPAAEVQFTAAVDQTTVGLGQQFQLDLTLSGENIGSVPWPDMPSMADVDVLDRSQSTSSNMSIINGQIKKESAVTFSYVLSAKKLGASTIPACKLKYNGQEYQSQPVAITVVKAGQGQASPRQQAMPGAPPQPAVAVEGNLFLTQSVDRKTVYLGEQVTIDFDLYTRFPQISNIGGFIPMYGSFWSEKLRDHSETRDFKFSRKTVDGTAYSVCPIRTDALFPMNAGDLTIGAQELAVIVPVPPRSFFDFGSQQEVKAKSKPLTIHVLPLPEGKPKDFSGGVGQFTISASLDRTSSSNSEPFNLTVKLSGTGNIRLIEKPVIPAIPGLKVLDPEVKEDIRAAGDVIRGTRTFRYPIMPQADGRFVIPALSLSYFDPASKSYKTVSTSPYECTASGCSQNAPLVEATGLKVLGSDINYIKPDAAQLPTVVPPPGGLLAAAYLLSFVLMGSAVWYRSYQQRLLTDQGFARKARSAKLVRQRLKQAEALLKKRDDKGFYAALSQAVIGYAGDRYDLETQAMTKEQLRDELIRLGVSADTVAQVIGIIEQCEIARFSPGLLAVKNPGELFAQAKSILSEL